MEGTERDRALGRRAELYWPGGRTSTKRTPGERRRSGSASSKTGSKEFGRAGVSAAAAVGRADDCCAGAPVGGGWLADVDDEEDVGGGGPALAARRAASEDRAPAEKKPPPGPPPLVERPPSGRAVNVEVKRALTAFANECMSSWWMLWLTLCDAPGWIGCCGCCWMGGCWLLLLLLFLPPPPWWDEKKSIGVRASPRTR